ncbi:MAG: hypothetical protein ABS53_06535 [Hydrogenophaga sp. SCN 70-13]|jgi:hypothetical protein|uniref:hypothetical protein n=1 Tax=unclassified Hydrogenophaga TaxID=2610897 RepID=UPI00086AACD6|nr:MULTISPECIES: hypothetical protein [unclassified Hydrogenophaga]MBN9370320.1 hypothetical protein [Hydrogenophaga sp.]ODT33015.1 MAG: hypothetical protein ABS53_06535 [Hydrogenophaga sp. SCN 70-13]OJV60254.1 MAG: hypothetical protein BGO22_16660 [Hydrogenophaga sp. 70-12]
MPDTEARDSPAPDPVELPEGRLVGRVAFADAVRQAIGVAASQAWPMLWLVDDDFADWPLGERSVIAGLNAWAQRGRRMRLLARDFSALRTLHPRFTAWRTTWSHLIEAHAVPQASPHELPGVIWTADWTLERLDPVRCSLVASRAPERRVALHERLDEWWMKGRPAFAPTTLGL